jgi:hypothetical protein
VPCETRMENSFDFYSMIKQCILWLTNIQLW